jgi:hypothetical protein
VFNPKNQPKKGVLQSIKETLPFVKQTTKNKMISNLQLKNIIGSEIKNCTENELNQIRDFLSSLASIEYDMYCQKKDKINAAKSDNRLDISSHNLTKLAA